MKRLTSHLYFWVLLAIVAGGTVGYVDPATGVALKPLGDGFIALVKMLISPIIFCTVVLGIVGAGDMKKVGRVGGKALIYFEVVSTFALAIGLVVANVVQPGSGFNADPATLDANAVADYAKRATTQRNTAARGDGSIKPVKGAKPAGKAAKQSARAKTAKAAARKRAH